MHIGGRSDMNSHTLKHSSKKYIVLLSALLILLLAGCSNASKAKILHGCNIISDEEYETYLDLDERGQFNQDGSYKADELNNYEDFIPPDGSIHVTFAKNDYIDVEYYLNSGLTTRVNPKQCYLMPGDCIYAGEPVCHHPSTDKYSFDRFCVYAYNEAGEKGEELSWETGEGSTLALHIPDDYEGTEVSVVPMGKYEERKLRLTDYYKINDDQKQELDGEWIVVANDKKVPIDDDAVAVSPVATLRVDYHYETDKYKFVESTPASFYHENGLVRFETIFPDEGKGIEQFSVELQEVSGHFEFDPAQYTVEHGAVEFSYNGSSINGVTNIDDGQGIHYKLTPDTGYRAKQIEGDIPVDADNEKKTKEAIRNAIKFFRDEDVIINLPQPTMGGTIEYSVDGKLLSGKTCSLRCGKVISMKFNHWNGWIVDANAKKEYTVTEVKNQTVLIDGSDISKLFTESDDHKPTLNVIVTDDMKTAQFSVLASENGKDNLNYEKGSKPTWIPDRFGQRDREIFGGEKIGTGSNLVLSVTDDTILNGQAMKLEIKTKDTKGNEEKIFRYVTELPVEQTIKLYGAGQQMTSPTVYESVTITVSKVDVSTYNTKSVDHAKVVVRVVDDDEPHTLQDGEVLEPSREVEVTIKPEDGWYITGSKLLNGEYSDTMKYSDWEKDRQKILEKHMAQKLWYVTLDTSDSYGTCVYKLDSIVVSGTVGIHDGQELKLEYKLTDSNYQIVRNGFGGFIGNLVNKGEESCPINVSEALDGTTIKRSDYITVERKED